MRRNSAIVAQRPKKPVQILHVFYIKKVRNAPCDAGHMELVIYKQQVTINLAFCGTSFADNITRRNVMNRY
jgi:hypothetical protein